MVNQLPDCQMLVGSETRSIAAATILVVEDDEALRKLIFNLLTDQGYAVFQAPDGETAKRIADRKKNGIDLLLTDVRMPGISGVELADELLARPDMKVLFISGYETDSQGRTLERNANFLPKPFTSAQLLSRVRDTLGR